MAYSRTAGRSSYAPGGAQGDATRDEVLCGVVDGIERKESVNGPYLRVQVGGRWYSCFDDKLFALLRRGAEIEATIAHQGKFSNMVGVMPVKRYDREPGDDGPAPLTVAPVSETMREALGASSLLLGEINLEPALKAGFTAEDVRTVAITMFIEKQRQGR